jgi:hypothetical protein
MRVVSQHRSVWPWMTLLKLRPPYYLSDFQFPHGKCYLVFSVLVWTTGDCWVTGLFLGALLVQMEEVVSHYPLYADPSIPEAVIPACIGARQNDPSQAYGSLNQKLLTVFPIAVSLITSWYLEQVFPWLLESWQKTLRIQTFVQGSFPKISSRLNIYADVRGAQGVSSNEWWVASAIYWCSRPKLMNKIKEPPNTSLDVGECTSRLLMEVQPNGKVFLSIHHPSLSYTVTVSCLWWCSLGVCVCVLGCWGWRRQHYQLWYSCDLERLKWRFP